MLSRFICHESDDTRKPSDTNLCTRYSSNNRGDWHGCVVRCYCRQKQSESNFEKSFFVTAPTVDVKTRFLRLLVEIFTNTFENKSGNTHAMLSVRVYGELSSNRVVLVKLEEEKQKTKN